MGMSKVERPVQRADAFADPTSSLWFSHHIHADSISDTDIERRKLNNLDASHSSLGCFKPKTEEVRAIDENWSISSHETQDDLCSLITSFSKLYPSTEKTNSENGKAAQDLESLLVRLAQPFSLGTQVREHHHSSKFNHSVAPTSTVQFPDSIDLHGQDDEITSLDIGRTPEKVHNQDHQCYPEHVNNCSNENFDHIRWMENLLMDIVNHLEYMASLPLPLITWNNQGTISAICRFRYARVAKQLINRGTKVKMESETVDAYDSDLQSVNSLLTALDNVNESIHQLALGQWERATDKAIGGRICQALVLSFELKDIFTLSKSRYQNFRASVLSLRQRISICNQVIRKLRCEEGLFSDDAALLCPNLQIDYNGEDFGEFRDLATVSRINVLVRYIRDLHSVRQENTLCVGGLMERVNELERKIDDWGKESDNLWMELNMIWTGSASSEIDECKSDAFNSLTDLLICIKAEWDYCMTQHPQVITEPANFYILRRIDESRLQIIDMESRLEEMEHRIEVLDKLNNWFNLCAFTQTAVSTLEDNIMRMLEERHRWAANLANNSTDGEDDGLQNQKDTIDKLVAKLQLQELEAMFDELEVLITMYRTGYPTILPDQQQSMRSDLTKLYDGLRFANSVFLQYVQVSAFQGRAADINERYVDFKKSRLTESLVPKLNETCKQVIELLLTSQIGVSYPQSSIYNIAKNVYANQQVKSGIGTIQISLSEMLDGLKELIHKCHNEEELRKQLEHTKMIAGRHKKQLQSQISSLEQYPVNFKARMTLSRIDECISNCKTSVEKPILTGIAEQANVLQSSKELEMVYQKETEIAALSERLELAQEKQRVNLEIIRTRSFWEACYDENSKLLEMLFDHLADITKSSWTYANRDAYYEPVDLAIWNSEKAVKLMIDEQIAFEIFQKEYFTIGKEDKVIQLILTDAENRHQQLANVQEIILLAQEIQDERMKQRSHIDKVRKTYEDIQKMADDIYNGLLEAIIKAEYGGSVYIVDTVEIQSCLTSFEEQCQHTALYPDCYQHTQLPERYSAELIESNAETRRYVSQIQDRLYQQVTNILEAHSVYNDLLSLLHESSQHHESCTNLLAHIAVPDDATLHDPSPIMHNTILTLVQCSQAQTRMTSLRETAEFIISKLDLLSNRAGKLQGQHDMRYALQRHTSSLMEKTRELYTIDKIVHTTIALHVRQNWENLWGSSKHKLEQCIMLLEVINGQDKSVPAESRNQSTDGAEQQFRFITQTDVASSNFAFRNLSKNYLCIPQSKIILQRLQQKHGELRRLASKIEWLLAKCRGHKDHMNSRGRKLSTPTALEGRARKISLPSRKTSNSLSVGGGYDGNLKASRSAVIGNHPRMRQNSSSRIQNRLRYVPDPANDLDVEVGRIINESPYQISVKAVPGEVGRYWFGEVQPKLAYCRILKSNMVMVRVGGGWTELTQFLRNHALLEGNFIPRERSLTEDEELRDGYIRTNSSRTSNNRSEQYGIKDGDRFIVGNGIEVKMTRAQDERTVPPRTSRANHLQN